MRASLALVSANAFASASSFSKVETFSKDAFYEFNEGNGSNLALGDGMQKVAANSDKILNETYGKLMNSLNKTDKKNLLNAQRSWVKLDNGIKEYNYALFNRYITGDN